MSEEARKLAAAEARQIEKVEETKKKLAKDEAVLAKIQLELKALRYEGDSEFL